MIKIKWFQLVYDFNLQEHREDFSDFPANFRESVKKLKWKRKKEFFSFEVKCKNGKGNKGIAGKFQILSSNQLAKRKIFATWFKFSFLTFQLTVFRYSKEKWNEKAASFETWRQMEPDP